MILRTILAIMAAWTALIATPAHAQSAEQSEGLLLTGQFLITVEINGTPVRLEVRPERANSLILNPDVAKRLKLRDCNCVLFGSAGELEIQRSFRQAVSFGKVKVPVRIWWLNYPVSQIADGWVGLALLPVLRATFELGPAQPDELVYRFPLLRLGKGEVFRVGAATEVGQHKMGFAFAPAYPENTINGETANFLATHLEGGFMKDSDGVLEILPTIRSPTRTMRLAIPLMLGDLPMDQFAVRFLEWSPPDDVGEIEDNDPRFEEGTIIVTRRKGRGRPGFFNLVGRKQMAGCSRLTFDYRLLEIELSCAASAE
jgi:hypothetical protein